MYNNLLETIVGTYDNTFKTHQKFTYICNVYDLATKKKRISIHRTSTKTGVALKSRTINEEIPLGDNIKIIFFLTYCI